MTHGWPGSIVEFTEVTGPLTAPSGRTPALNALTVQIPSARRGSQLTAGR